MIVHSTSIKIKALQALWYNFPASRIYGITAAVWRDRFNSCQITFNLLWNYFEMYHTQLCSALLCV